MYMYVFSICQGGCNHDDHEANMTVYTEVDHVNACSYPMVSYISSVIIFLDFGCIAV